MDKQKLLIQALWRKARMEKEPLRLDCKTQSKAIRMRFALYNAVKHVRSGLQPADEALRDAVMNVTIGFDPDEPHVLVLRQKVESEMMQTIADVLGVDTDKLWEVEASAAVPGQGFPRELVKTEEQAAMEASFGRLQGVLAAEPTEQQQELMRRRLDYSQLQSRAAAPASPSEQPWREERKDDSTL